MTDSEDPEVISSSVDDAMYEDGSFFEGIERKVVANYNVAVSY